ncbi:hypothetical protein Tco_1152867 [Tanacetum coccineum]
MDSNPSQTFASTPVVTEMYQEDQHATGDLKSLGVTSEERANPQLSSGLETILTQPITKKRASSITRQVEEEEASRIIKLVDLTKLVSHVQPSFKDLDSPEDDPIIVVDDSDKDEEADKDKGFTTVLAILVTETSQSRQHVNTTSIHIESCMSPTAVLFDVDTGRISIVTVNTKEYHYDVLTRFVHFGFSNQRLELTATYSISTISE